MSVFPPESRHETVRLRCPLMPKAEMRRLFDLSFDPRGPDLVVWPLAGRDLYQERRSLIDRDV